MKNWDKREKRVIAQGCVTYSRRSDQFVKGVYPTHAVGGRGELLIAVSECKDPSWDHDTYVDYICGLGSNVLSINNCFSLPYTGEVLLGEKLVELFPCIEKIKILKSGTEACNAAVRIARAYKENTTHKDKEIMGLGHGYHGWGNLFIAEEDPGLGTYWEGYTKSASISDIIREIKQNPDDCNYCIIEPVQVALNARVVNELEELRELCTRYAIVLIFDEIITGFRTPKYCISNYLGIQPDLLILGKAMANGFPISVVGGPTKIMNTDGYFVSTTFASERTAIDEALITIEQITPKKLQKLWDLGTQFQIDMNEVLKPINVKMTGIGSRAIFEGDEDKLNLFWQEACRRGFLFGKSWFLTMAHTEEVLQKTVKVCEEVVEYLLYNNPKLEGEPRKEVFKRV